MLTDAAIEGKIDRLVGLKENVIIGKLIPAATGLKRYRTIEIKPAEKVPVAALRSPGDRRAATRRAGGDRLGRRWPDSATSTSTRSRMETSSSRRSGLATGDPDAESARREVKSLIGKVVSRGRRSVPRELPFYTRRLQVLLARNGYL